MTSLTRVIHKKKMTVGYSAIDYRGYLKIAGIMNFLQDTASEHASLLGLSGMDLARENLGWVIHRYHIDIYHYPSWQQPISIRTFRYPQQKIYEMRNFTICTQKNISTTGYELHSPAIKAKVRWVMISRDTGKPVRLNRFMDENLCRPISGSRFQELCHAIGDRCPSIDLPILEHAYFSDISLEPGKDCPGNQQDFPLDWKGSDMGRENSDMGRENYKMGRENYKMDRIDDKEGCSHNTASEDYNSISEDYNSIYGEDEGITGTEASMIPGQDDGIAGIDDSTGQTNCPQRTDQYRTDQYNFPDIVPPLKTNFQMPFSVRMHDLDLNGHVNNAVFVEWAVETVPEDILSRYSPMTIDVIFQKEALYGDTVVSKTEVWLQPDSSYPLTRHLITRERDQEELAHLNIQWRMATSHRDQFQGR
ncbi:MAG: hypothetical protein HQK66_03465 [Desulfamplus sp.]|nr:hypothetical protein [Desulfamplus sp.]